MAKKPTKPAAAPAPAATTSPAPAPTAAPATHEMATGSVSGLQLAVSSFAKEAAKPGAPVADIFVLALAIALPRVPEGTTGETPVFVEGAIQRFATPDGAQFDVVHVNGVLHAQPVIHPKEDTDGQA